MKKFLIGVVVGAVIATVSSAYADDIAKLIGKPVDAEFLVYLNGVRLKDNAVGIEGTSYAPVRSLTEALGLNVDFKDGNVLVTTAKQTEVKSMQSNIQTPMEPTIQSIDREIENLQTNLKTYHEPALEYAKKNRPDAVPAAEAAINDVKAKIAELEKQKAELSSK
ncbi:hypothetical protein [Paenibacillus sp. GYB003]|uniref:hypothetical protein n=1 Tax=Paenibacillus sp. GYB003 TaxID=2994392 RepID=UPI002F96E0D2